MEQFAAQSWTLTRIVVELEHRQAIRRVNDSPDTALSVSSGDSDESKKCI